MRQILIVFLISCVSTTTARADVAPGTVPIAGPAQIALRREGVEGVWFRADIAERLLHDIQAARLAADLEVLYTRKIELLSAEIAASQRLLDLAEQGEMRASDALDRAVFSRQTAEQQRDAWHRSPALWFAAGVIVAAFAAAAGAYAITQ